MKRSKHHHVGDPAYNNPLANRFDKPQSKFADEYSRIAYVLQGGGALGAYQAGVVKGLLEAGYEPDWVSATSIGAIMGAIIVGNAPENRIARLQEFWDRISTKNAFDILGYNSHSLNIYNQISSNYAVLFGQPNFFVPRIPSPYFSMASTEQTPDTISAYDTEPLRKTLLDLVDFDLLNSCSIRLSLGAVQVGTGKLIYFNNINYIIGPEHVMASAALPPGFPAIKIDNEYYWDGGIHSNTPLEVILDAKPAADTLCFVIDCFGGAPFIPIDIEEVSERSKDISYTTHARRAIKHLIEKQRLLIKLQALAEEAELHEVHKQTITSLMNDDIPHQYTLAHISSSSRLHRLASKDYNFGQVIIKKRMDIGCRDVLAMLAESHKWENVPEKLECRLYEAPNNLSRLMRVDD